MTKKSGTLIGTIPELREALAGIAAAYPALRWCDGDRLVEGLDDLGPQTEETDTLLVDLDDGVAYMKCAVAKPYGHSMGEFAFAADAADCLALAKRVYGPPKSTAKVTLEWLKARHACAEGQAWFIENFGKAGAVSRKALETLLEDDNESWFDWLRAHPN